MRKKAVSLAHRRAVAQELVKNQACSQRMACRILRLARSTFRYRGRVPTPKEEQLGGERSRDWQPAWPSNPRA